MPKSQAASPVRPDEGVEEAPPAEAAVRVLRRFRVVFNAVKGHFQQVERRAGIGGAQVWALSLIAAGPGLSVGQLAGLMDIHQTTASNLVRSLLKSGLVHSVRDGTDRRTVRLSVADPGLVVLRRVPGPFAGVLPDALARLDTQTLLRLDRDLGRLIELLKADPDAAGVPLAQL
jgi:DNA-binding MarR family transcriptional regulator